jgi:hypothetical protein
MKRLLVTLPAAALLVGLGLAPAVSASTNTVSASSTHTVKKPECENNASICAEVYKSIGYQNGYTGHDEPSLLFYSSTAGSGNTMSYHLTLPKEPPTAPTQDGNGGTDNFQLRATFWFGMAICNDQSAPNPGGSSVGPTVLCQPDSDSNIYNSSDPTKSHYIGRHPGTAFLELQLYPPGWAPFQSGGISCAAHQWCAAMVIWSLAQNQNTGQSLNTRCASITGVEYPNFAFITKDGASQAPANPVEATAATFTPNASKDLFMNGGDNLSLSFGDSAHGLTVNINDHTSGEAGSMTASAANGFGEVQFAPTGGTCNNIPYDFHPMYSTSSTATRIPWAAHSYNVAFSDEIGHFEYCNAVSGASGSCRTAGASEPNGQTDGDDTFCFPASSSLLVPVTGCTGSDGDFDGVSYQNTWPGTNTDAAQDAAFHSSSLLLSSPLSNGNNYQQAAFEADLPRIERSDFGGSCNGSTGANCVNPPPGAAFYPIYTTTNNADTGCAWQLGGPSIPNTTNAFGGTSAAEYGTKLLKLAYPSVGGPVFIYEDFRHILSTNPCQATS